MSSPVQWGVNGCPVSTAVHVCPFLAPWGFSDPVSLADLGRTVLPHCSDYSCHGGGEKSAFLLLIRLREAVYHFWVGCYPSAKNDLLTLQEALRAVIGEIIAYAECKEKMLQRNKGL